jgi:EAL domain-containing protein (putative c-di-GMP-specific phosphodiesterase class I)
MRVWGLDDVKAMPGDMVLEQDFIMRLRHILRQATPYLIINVTFNAVTVEQHGLEAKEKLQRVIGVAAHDAGGEAHFMANGDCFVAVPLSHGKTSSVTAQPIIAAAGVDAALATELFHCFTMPSDYPQIRERTNHYVEAARAAAMIGVGNPSPGMALRNDAVRGPLTPWALDQIEKLFAEIDVRNYVRHQNIYRRAATGWTISSSEYFVGIDDLQRERFPRLEIRTPERLFMELCSALDHRLLAQFAEHPDSLAAGSLHLNIAVDSVLGAPFAKFCNAIPPDRRRAITFELNRGDLFLNFTTTLAAIALLRQEGFAIAVDALHPELLPYLNLQKLAADFYKVRVSKDILEQLSQTEVLRAFQTLPADKIIFYRCDTEAALAIGRQLGVTLYQGWLIDDAVSAP